MDKLKLISIRVIPETLQEVDNLASKHGYLNRSVIINNILRNVILCANPDVLWKIISTYSPHTCGYSIDFKVDREKLQNLPHDE